MKGELIKIYWVLGALILAASGLVKLATAAGDDLWLHLNDPVFPNVTMRAMMLWAGLIETVISVIVLMSRDKLNKIVLICCAGGLVLSYRAYKAVIGSSEPCPCLGKLPHAIGLNQQHGDSIALTVAVLLFLLGWWCMIAMYREDEMKGK